MTISPEDENLWKMHIKGVKKHDQEKKQSFDIEEVKPFTKPKMKLQPETAISKIRSSKRDPKAIDATIDLHGFTRQESYEKLCSFINSSYNLGRKCVLVITGKGREGAEGLKEKVPKWLDTEILSPMIIGFVQAPSDKGGAGALLIYIKKNKEL